MTNFEHLLMCRDFFTPLRNCLKSRNHLNAEVRREFAENRKVQFIK